MLFKTSITLLNYDNEEELGFQQYQVELNLDIDHERLRFIYDIKRPEVEQQILLSIKNGELDMNEDEQFPHYKPTVFPFAEFVLENRIYHVLLYGQFCYQFMVCSDLEGYMIQELALTEALSEELFERNLKTVHQDESISLYALMLNYLRNYFEAYEFEQYLHQPLIGEECLLIDMIDY